MILKIHPVLATLIITGILILCFALFRGCKRYKIELAAKEKVAKIADSAIKELARFKSVSDSSSNEFSIREELLNGQIDLLENKLDAKDDSLDEVLGRNKELISKHKLGAYADTTSVTVPGEYVQDCKNCFEKLEMTTSLTMRYKHDINNLQKKWDDQNILYQGRFRQLESERLVFYNKMQSLATQAKDVTDKLKPHGKLYLSCGIMWAPWPIAGGAGLMYQAKNNMIYGGKWYYGNRGQIVETTLSLPLSLRFK